MKTREICTGFGQTKQTEEILWSCRQLRHSLVFQKQSSDKHDIQESLPESPMILYRQAAKCELIGYINNKTTASRMSASHGYITSPVTSSHRSLAKGPDQLHFSALHPFRVSRLTIYMTDVFHHDPCAKNVLHCIQIPQQ